MSSDAVVTAIIPTMAVKERRNDLFRAISSLSKSTKRPPSILVVVNGSRFDPLVLEELSITRDVEFLQIETPSAPNAQLEGRRRVGSDFFCYLDDDDEYLPGALDRKIDLMLADPDVDLLVGNGHVQGTDGQDRLLWPSFKDASESPMKALLVEGNWLSSCGGVYRTSSIPVEFFEGFMPHLERTWLAYRLMLSGKRVAFEEKPRVSDPSNRRLAFALSGIPHGTH